MNNIIDTFKDNNGKLKTIIMKTTCLDNGFLVEYYYRNSNNLIGVEYFSYKDYNYEKYLETIISMYNRYVSNRIFLRGRFIVY